MMSRSISTSLTGLTSKNVPAVRALRRTYSELLRTVRGPSVIKTALQLVEMGSWERFLAYELIAHHEAAQRVLHARDVIRLGRGMQSWADVDCFACYVAGPAWRQGRISNAVVQRWARSHDRWWRRAALVSTVPLNNRARGGTGDTARTLAIAGMLVHDRDDMVVKALSWVLRELSKRDRKAVQQFVRRHKNSLAARVTREVGNKLRTGVKNPRRTRT